MPTDYLPFATGSGSNVEAQTDYAGSAHQTQGFTTGTAKSAQANKVWRQATMMAAAWANFISNTCGVAVNDDGNLNALINLINTMLQTVSGNLFRPRVIVVPWAAAMTFDCTTANPIHPVFETTLAGDVNSSVVTNYAPGQLITFHIRQDGNGNHSFTPPAGVPMGAVHPGAGNVSIQTFSVLSDGNMYATTPMMAL